MGGGRGGNGSFPGVVGSMSEMIAPGDLAPDFELDDVNGNRIRLSTFREYGTVVLYFLRGFM